MSNRLVLGAQIDLDAQNFRIVKEEPVNAKSGLFSLKSDFRMFRYPPNHLPGVKFWKISPNFPNLVANLNEISVGFKSKSPTNIPETMFECVQ